MDTERALEALSIIMNSVIVGADFGGIIKGLMYGLDFDSYCMMMAHLFMHGEQLRTFGPSRKENIENGYF